MEILACTEQVLLQIIVIRITKIVYSVMLYLKIILPNCIFVIWIIWSSKVSRKGAKLVLGSPVSGWGRGKFRVWKNLISRMGHNKWPGGFGRYFLDGQKSTSSAMALVTLASLALLVILNMFLYLCVKWSVIIVNFSIPN